MKAALLWATVLCGSFALVAADTTVDHVYVVQSCHLDVGFAEIAPDIVNLYFDSYFAKAIAVAKELKAMGNPGGADLKWMTHSYLVSLYLSCPSGMGLHCPNATAVADFQEAVKQGVIWWHAFPFNAELAMGTPNLIKEGIDVSQSLAKEFGVTVPQVLSQRDVPGISAGAIPTLLAAGVNTVTVGVNSASTPPGVPKLFKWQQPGGSDFVYAMWHPFGYGGYTKEEAVILDNGYALVTDWNGDNAGPFDAKDYVAHWQTISQTWPNATVQSATWEDFTKLLPAISESLPVITAEIADTWVHGTASDPMKVAKMRAMYRAWDAYLADGGVRDAVYLNASRLLVKGIEHTWGKDVKKTLFDNADWSNADFNRARKAPATASQFSVLEESWWRQRDWAIKFPLQALQEANHPLLKYVMAELDAIQPHAPTTSILAGFSKVDPSKPVSLGEWSIGFDTATGGINSLIAGSGGRQWASTSSPLAQLLYRTYSAAEVEAFINAYLAVQPPPSWAQHDFGKPNVSLGNPVARQISPALSELYARQPSAGAAGALWAHLSFPSDVVELAGAPADVWMLVEVPSDTASPLNVSFNVINKTSTRLPEAFFVRFGANQTGSSWTMNKLNQWLPLNTTVPGGSQHLHAVSTTAGVRMQLGGDTLSISSVDAAVCVAGEPTGYPTPLKTAPDTTKHGVGFLLADNLWGTNYIMWTPFASDGAHPEEPSLLYRFQLQTM